MYYYLFTNDLRISTLADSLQNAGKCFVNDTVPKASEDKSANNNMKTLGFYFNLTNNSNCSKLAADGDVRSVVLNFIKKFQFPNTRTKEAYQKCVENGIILAPMREIVKLLYTMKLLYESENAFITKEEIKYFIFYNEEVAKKKKCDMIKLIQDIFAYRKNGTLPINIDDNADNHEWKQEDRQLREMLKVLLWSGCIKESENLYRIAEDNLSSRNKADIFDIINYDSYWEGNTEESYQEYMDCNYIYNENVNQENSTVGTEFVGENILLYGVPGAGKSHKIATEYCNDPKSIVRVVFHPDYTYSDFVGQILPRLKGKDLTYEFVPGPFTEILDKAYHDPDNMYYLIIEEINRGNAPAIFGEIFQLLDRKDDDKYSSGEAGESEYGIVNYDVAKKVYDDPEHMVKIPSNLTLIATMNTADQNVFTLDTAFQRRWNMEHIENDVPKAKHAHVEIQGTGIEWGDFAVVINDLIVEKSAEIATSADKRLGAYFVKERELQSDKFPEKVLKYLWDDAFKMDHEYIFRDDMNSLEKVISTYNTAETKKLESVLRMDVYQKMLRQSVNDEEEGDKHE